MAKKKILLVDDEAIVTRTLKLYLEKTGKFEVREENKGTAALQAARRFKPDLILLDIIMPDVAGTDVAASVKADPELSSTPIVFLTATVSREEVGDQGSMVGNHQILAKPVNPKAVIQCIETHLE